MLHKTKAPITANSSRKIFLPLPLAENNNTLKASDQRPTEQNDTATVLKELALFIESEGGVLTP